MPEGRQDFEFFAVADPSINAFALPGGYVGVNTGLILLAQNESELAAVLAHEITHVTQHHIARCSSAQQRSLLLLARRARRSPSRRRAPAARPAASSPSAAIARRRRSRSRTQINFTRENEYEADRIGFQRLDAAGFDVDAMATFMSRMQKSGQFSDGGAPSYLRTHPITYERIAEAQSRALRQAVPPGRRTRSTSSSCARCCAATTAPPKEAVAFFTTALAEHKFNNEIAARYGLVASLLRDKNYKQAQGRARTLEKIGAAAPDDRRDGRPRAIDAGDARRSPSRASRRRSPRYPNKMQLVYDYPEALLEGRPRARRRDVPRARARRAFPATARCTASPRAPTPSSARGMQQYRHQAEFYAWQGDLRGAVVQLELAAKAGDGDFYQASVVETRLRALRRELAEQQAMAKNG